MSWAHNKTNLLESNRMEGRFVVNFPFLAFAFTFHRCTGSFLLISVCIQHATLHASVREVNKCCVRLSFWCMWYNLDGEKATKAFEAHTFIYFYWLNESPLIHSNTIILNEKWIFCFCSFFFSLSTNAKRV